MSSDEIKEELVDLYGGKESDWKRISKKKKNIFEIRVFENKKLNLTKTVISEDDEIIMPEYFPTGEFWIYINEKDLDPKDIDESKSYFDPNFIFNGHDNENTIYTMVILKSPNSDYWYDQHCSHLIEYYFGVKDFSSMFDEPSENSNILIKDIPVGEIRKMCEKAGMKFLGYRNVLVEN